MTRSGLHQRRDSACIVLGERLLGSRSAFSVDNLEINWMFDYLHGLLW